MRRPKACPYRRSDGTHWARVRYIDESGKTRDKVVQAESAADARAKSIELVKKYDEGGDSQPKPITFNKFAELFIPHIEGQRSYKPNLGFLRTLQDHFGNKQLGSITYRDIQAYAKKRRNTKSLRTGKKFKTASVNREVALLSRMFNEAIEQGFVVKNPCKDGPRLIKPEEETKRDRILSKEEEERLLAVCTGRRVHLRAIIIAALETGATKSLLLRLTWGDVHIGLRNIGFRVSENETVNVEMGEALTSVLAPIYRKLEDVWYETRDEDTPSLREWMAPIRIFSDPKSAFPSACRAAGIKDFRFNDLRRTHFARRNSPEAVVARTINAALAAAARKQKIKFPF